MQVTASSNEKWFDSLTDWRLWTVPMAMTALLVVVAQFSYGGFHILVELFAIIMSYILFAFAWSTRSFNQNNYLLILACGYFWIGSLDFIHTFVAKNVDFFVIGNNNLASQFWLGSRYSEALLLLIAPFVVSKKLNDHWLIIGFGGVAVVLSIMIFSGRFPDGFVEGKGLSDFKVYSEYLIILLLGLSLVTLFSYGRDISQREKVIIAAATVLTMCAELAFSLYTSAVGFQNFIGHIFKLFSFWLVFNAIVYSNLKKPYTALQGTVEELNEYRSMLELRVQERTSELEEEKTKAEIANAAKGIFLAAMSHEIRTPMNGVLGMAELLNRSTLNDQQRSYLQSLTQSGDIMMAVVNDILDYSKIVGGDIELELIDFDIHRWLESMATTFFNSNDDSVNLILTIDPDLPKMLRGDVTRLQQIISNLLTNAIKFTTEGSIELKAQKLSLDDRQCLIRISVTDTGIGIPSDQIDNILLPFTQAEITTTRKYGGTGLGLPICKNLVEAMNSEIHIDSVSGKGSSFFFDLCLDLGSVVPTVSPTLHLDNDYTSLKVLLVEDNPTNQLVAKGQLSKLGINPVLAADGSEALKCICGEGKSFDLVLMDCEMPVMDGYEATTRIRAWERENSVTAVPIFALTAHVLAENTQRCLDVGMNGKLTKPIKIKDYLPALDSVLK